MNRVVAGLVCVLLLVGVSQGQEFPKPGPEHEMLKKLEGVWEATVKSSFEPGKPPTESKGTATYKISSLIGSQSSSRWIGRPVWSGRVVARSMPRAW